MASIHWTIWLVVGAGMYFITQLDAVGAELKFFQYIGLAFVVIGIFKMLISFVLGGKKRKVKGEIHDLQHHQYTCPRCRNIIAGDFRYCPHCGSTLR